MKTTLILEIAETDGSIHLHGRRIGEVHLGGFIVINEQDALEVLAVSAGNLEARIGRETGKGNEGE